MGRLAPLGDGPTDRGTYARFFYLRLKTPIGLSQPGAAGKVCIKPSLIAALFELFHFHKQKGFVEHADGSSAA
jgi:hypothetical protein